MNDGDELLGKAEALLSRYRATTGHQMSSLPDYPVLTEIVETEVTPAPLESAKSAPDPTSNPTIALDQELTQLEEEIRQSVLKTIESHVVASLGESLEIRLKDHLELSLERLAREIATSARVETVELIRKAVSEAVEQEISHLRTRIER